MSKYSRLFPGPSSIKILSVNHCKYLDRDTNSTEFWCIWVHLQNNSHPPWLIPSLVWINVKPHYWSPFCITSSHLSYMLAFSWQNILVPGMTGISYLGQEIKNIFPWKGVRVPDFSPLNGLGTAWFCSGASNAATVPEQPSEALLCAGSHPWPLQWFHQGAKFTHLLTHSENLEKNCFWSSSVLESQQIADPDVERQQEWGKTGNRAL